MIAKFQNTLIIHDATPVEITHDPRFGRGCIPRDLTVDPKPMFMAPDVLPVVPQSEWSQRYADKKANGSLLSQIRNRSGPSGQPIPSLNQRSYGYCWAHSTTHAAMMARACSGQEYIPLSAYAIAATIKKGANEGGWCGLSAQFARERGIPSQTVWPQDDVNYRGHDKPETWADAGLHKITGDVVDLTKQVWEAQLNFAQVVSFLLTMPGGCMGDFNFWSHSVNLLDAVPSTGAWGETRLDTGKIPTLQEFEIIWGVNTAANGTAILIWNSWGDEWSNNGTGLLTGSHAVPDEAIGVYALTPG